jgi:hypothetical protein
MKCAYLREMEQENPEYSDEDRRAAKKARRPYNVPRFVKKPAGTVVDHPEAWRLVRMGVAEPVDDECREAANVSEERLKVLAAKYERLNKGMGTGDPRYDAAATVSEDESGVAAEALE